MVNLEKIQAAFDKISSNPILLEGLNTEMNKMVEQLGIQLDIDERFVLLSKLAEQRSPVSALVNVHKPLSALNKQ